MSQVFTVYIVKCADETFYTGYTRDVARRMFQHNNSKKGARYTRYRRPVVIVHKEEYGTLSEALRREYDIKQMKKEGKLGLIINGKA